MFIFYYSLQLHLHIAANLKCSDGLVELIIIITILIRKL